MGLLNIISNEVKAAIGYQQNFADLLTAKDVTRALSMMKAHAEEAANNLREYKIDTHKVMERKDRAVYDKKGNFLRWSKRWKIPIPYPQFINEISLVFLYGRPVKWQQLSTGTDYAFQNYKDWLNEIHFNAKVREAKRLAGAEGISAILYHVYRDSDNKPSLLLNVLSRENNDDIYTIRDQYKRITAFAWGYYLTEAGNNTVYHVDIYTKETVYRAKRGKMGWEVEIKDNPIGKIPVLIFEQTPEHKEVQPMIERSEIMESTDADTNDRFSNPAMVATSEILNSLPKSEEEAKLFILKNGGDVRYLTWNEASESKKNEFERLDKHILSKSFTPNIDFDNMKSLGNLSAKAIRKVMLLAVIKAERHKEKHDDYMKRHANLMTAILGNVLDYRHKAEYDALLLRHEFQEPFGEDVSELLADLSKQYNDGAFYFGDGTGSYNDYGQTIYLQDKIHVPEVYPAPSFKENSVFIEIKQGITTMWGEIDTDNLLDFYKTYAYPTGQNKFIKEEGTNVWKHPEGKLSASELNANRAVFIEMRTFINGTGGTVHTGTKPLSKGGKRFKLTSSYPNNWIGLDIRTRSESTNKITYSLSYEYRGRYAYYLLKEEDKYYLVDFADWSKRMPLPIKDCPVDWMN